MYRKKFIFFVIIVLLLSGCTKINKNLDEVVDATMTNSKLPANTVSTGYELYIPTGVKQVVDSNYNRTKGADMGDMTDIMVKYGAINATNLDGGTSSVMAVNGELISHPIDSALNNETRPIATAFVVRD